MTEHTKEPIHFYELRRKLYKIMLVLFIFLYYFNEDLDHDLVDFLECSLLGTTLLVVILEVIKLWENFKNRYRKS